MPQNTTPTDIETVETSLEPARRFIFGPNGMQETALEQVSKGHSIEGFEWLHLDRRHADTRRWLESQNDITPVVVEALLADETRPRYTTYPGGHFLNLRGINLNPGMQADDMVSLRAWVTGKRLITVRRVSIAAIQDAIEEIHSGILPRSPFELVSHLAKFLTTHISETSSNLIEELDAIEEAILSEPEDSLRYRMTEARRQAITLKRYLAPQKDALGRWITALEELQEDDGKVQAKETLDAVLRFLEDQDAFRDRSALIQEEFLARLSARLNQSIFFLTVLSAFFLPLTFVTGLLGVNLSGIPYSSAEWAFGVLCAALLLLGIVEVYLLTLFNKHWRRRRL